MSTELSLIVLRSSDVDAARRFYEAIGLTWQEEQHGSGPKHHSARVGEILFELYPARDGSGGRVRLAFCVEYPQQTAEAAIAAGGRRLPGKHRNPGMVVEDPDGNQVELLPSRAGNAIEPAASLTYDAARGFVRSYSSRPGEFDVNGIIHLMLAALDNLHEHWIDADFEQIALCATPEQRQRLISIGEYLTAHVETPDDESNE
jgi:catechol 2,3-dioxygenase-like lactoylglutathione lyase family enzyme